MTVHEAVPGHHLQNALNNELGDSIPQFRRNLYLSAYGEGWGLYTEFLADEMGIYTTPYEKFGKFTYEMWRACRLVVDTGIHAKGWSREQAVNYMSSNTALSLHEVNTEIDRYISWPGQALSYKIGELKIRELRSKAEDKLGQKFDSSIFNVGEVIDVRAKSKGKGFAGTIKRHNFARQDATHGNKHTERAPGSIGQASWPSRVFKGMKMAGRKGSDNVTVQNLEIVDIDKENNLLFIKGAIPGANNAPVFLLKK